MKELRKALATIPNTRPIFKLKLHTYYQNTLEAETVCDNSARELVDGEPFEVEWAKKLFVEEYDRQGAYYTQYDSSVSNMESEIQVYLTRFLKQHMTAKHIKNTALYKFTERCRYYMRECPGADEAFYSTFKYLYMNSAVDQESKNIHVQNGLKILETLRSRYEEKEK